MKQSMLGLGGLTLAATLATVGLVLFDYPVLGAIIGTATVALWLILLAISIVAVTSWWSANLMERGANLALRSQESDDKRDVQLVRTLGALSRREQPALPMPTQSSWLPELSEFEEVENGRQAL